MFIKFGRNKHIFLIAVLIGFFAFLTKFAMHLGFQTYYWDLYFTDSSLWHVTQGHGLYLSIQGRSFFSDHFYPFFYLIAPFYFIHATPIWLFLFQATGLTVCILPILKLAEKYFGKKGLWGSILLILAYFPFRAAMIQEVHGEIVIAALIAWVIYFLETKRFWPAVILTLLIGLAKETAVVTISMIGLYFILFERRIRTGLALIVFGLLHAILILKFFIPSFGVTEYAYVGRYAYLGSGFSSVFKTILTQPWRPILHFFSLPTLGYLVALLLPFAFLPLLSPYLLIGVGIILQNCLAETSSQMADISTHYTIPLIPILFLAFITQLHVLKSKWSAEKFHQWVGRFKKITVFCIVLNLFLFTFLELRRYMINSAHVEASIHGVQHIPKNASISASNSLFPRVHYRKHVFLYPELSNADYVLVALPEDTFPMDVQAGHYLKTEFKQGHYGRLLWALIKGEPAVRRSDDPYMIRFNALLKSKQFHLIFKEEKIYVFKKNVSEI